MKQKMGERQRWAWLAGGLSVALGVCGCGLGWLWVLVGGLITGLYYLYIERTVPTAGLASVLPKAVAVLVLIWTIVAMAWSANLADSAFPMVEGFPTLGWTMLALAAWGSWKGPRACAGCAGVLCLFLLILYGIVWAFALPDVELANLRPVEPWKNGLWAVGLFLLPAGVWFLPCRCEKRPGLWPALLLPVAGAGLAAVTAGVLSPLLASSLPSPLYALAQSISLFGVVERIEPLLSAAMTMGAFCLLSAMACACRSLWPGKWSSVAACGVAAVLMGLAGKMPIVVLTIGGVLFWVAIPILTLFLVRKKEENHNL